MWSLILIYWLAVTWFQDKYWKDSNQITLKMSIQIINYFNSLQNSRCALSLKVAFCSDKSVAVRYELTNGIFWLSKERIIILFVCVTETVMSWECTWKSFLIYVIVMIRSFAEMYLKMKSAAHCKDHKKIKWLVATQALTANILV